MDRFSTFLKLKPLTALETAELIFNHLCRYYGIPEDIVSDRGAQFDVKNMEGFYGEAGDNGQPHLGISTERMNQEI